MRYQNVKKVLALEYRAVLDTDNRYPFLYKKIYT